MSEIGLWSAELPLASASPSPWWWPIDATRYDRSPTLTPAERAALTALGWEVRRGRCHDLTRPEWGALAGLVRPLDDARAALIIPATRYHRRCAYDAIALVLRACATIASQLYNAKEPMTLFELQAWLGHRSVETTQHYARIAPTTLAKAYSDAGYFARNMRTIEALIDRDSIETGVAAAGTPWQYFDLGHGYCTYSFFEQCPHRMACARCDFYVPKGSTKAQLLEAKGNLQRMLASIPLTDDERGGGGGGRGARSAAGAACRRADAGGTYPPAVSRHAVTDNSAAPRVRLMDETVMLRSPGRAANRASAASERDRAVRAGRNRA